MKKKSGFTLVELLIVIVIIGILSNVILPKINGYFAKVRDLQRKLDLQTLATAIEQYQQHYGLTLPKDRPSPEQSKKYPNILSRNPVGGRIHKPNVERMRDLYALGSVKYLKTALSPYLTTIPKDPQKNSHLRALSYGCYKYMQEHNKKDCLWDGTMYRVEDGEYFFIQLMTAYNTHGRTILAAKVETPDAANWVGGGDFSYSASWGNVDAPPYYAAPNHKYFKERFLKPKCTSIKKGDSIKKSTPEDSNCIYTDTSQLFYLVDIE